MSTSTSSQPKKSFVENFFETIGKTPIQELAFWIALILGIQSQQGKKILGELCDLGDVLGAQGKKIWNQINRLILFPARVYFGLLAASLVVFGASLLHSPVVTSYIPKFNLVVTIIAIISIALYWRMKILVRSERNAANPDQKKLTKLIEKAKDLRVKMLFWITLLVAGLIAYPSSQLHNENASLAIVIGSSLLLAIFVNLFNRKINEEVSGQEKGIFEKAADSFSRFIKNVSTFYYLFMVAYLIMVFLPDIIEPKFRLGILAVFVTTLFLAVALDSRWKGGLTILMIICIALIGTQAFFGEATVTGWYLKQTQNLNVYNIEATQNLQCYDLAGTPLPGKIIPKGTVVLADFNDYTAIAGGGTATMVYIHHLGGTNFRVFLQEGLNYRTIKPGSSR